MESYDYIYAVNPGRFEGKKLQPPIHYPVKLELDGTYDVDSVINLLKERLLSVYSISITEDGNISFNGILK